MPTITVLLLSSVAACLPAEPILDPSFEQPQDKNQWGHVFAHWGGWIYEGKCEFRVSDLAHSGKHSLLMVGGLAPKIRAWPEPRLALEPGRYRVTAYLRGLDIGTGPYNQTTEFMFGGDYMKLKKNGTFGWTKFTYVGDLAEKKTNAHPSFGLMAPGYLWVDDVKLEKVDATVPLQPPTFGREEKAIAPPGRVGKDFVVCPECAYRNDASWGGCYACGTALGVGGRKKSDVPEVRVLADFEEKNPFSGGKVVTEHAAQGKRALRLDRSYASMDATQDWLGYDYLKADVHTAATKPLNLSVEIRDRGTKGYWTRVNYNTVVPPGKSTLVVPTNLYVGEKSRPGRPLQLEAITRLVFAIGDAPEAPLYIDNVRLERDTLTEKVRFDGLWAFDLGPPGSPVLEGYQPLDVAKVYSPGRGFGWKDAKFWRVYDVLQPDPLYQDFICVEKGGLALDVPNGSYHVFVNMDSPSAYWGEYQRYRKRALILEGLRAQDTLDLASFKKRYYRHWNREDLPGDDTFTTYQEPYYSEKFYEVRVRDGQLNIEFDGQDWANCVSAIVVYPADKAEEGQRFLDFTRQRRRFHFANAFKRVLPASTGLDFSPTAAEKKQGFALFARDWMKDVQVGDRPEAGERATELTASAFSGEYEPVALSLFPLRDLGQATLTVSDLAGPGGKTIPAARIDVGHVRHRLHRLNEEGSVYTIAPKWILPEATAPVPAGVTRTFWLTVKVPAGTTPGTYSGTIEVAAAKGGKASLPLKVRVRKGTLDAVDIPAGPWGHTIDLPWYDPDAAAWNHALADRSLKKLREYGFTTASGLPIVSFHGVRGGVPVFDFGRADAQMRLFRANGFTMPVVTYCPFEGLNLYYKDEGKMRAAGFADYAAFVRTVFGGIQQHAEDANWLPVYWNIADEPIGGDLDRAAENAEAYRRAFPKGPPFFTGASSFKGNNTKDPHFRLSRALHVADWNTHDEAAVRLVQQAGGDWAFYNGGNRWTYGVYMYKAAKEFGMKFRVSWHWNNVAGDPYYALDCREDDYAWCNTSPDGKLIPAVHFERLREGLDDYRRLLTLARLAKAQAGTAPARQAESLLADLLGGFRLGERDLKGVPSYTVLRQRLDDAIEALR